MSNPNFQVEAGVEKQRADIRHSYQACFVVAIHDTYTGSCDERFFYGEEAREQRAKNRRDDVT